MKQKKINLNLEGQNSPSIHGIVTAYLRSDGEYQVEHKNRWTNPISDFPGPQYEVDLISIIPQLIGSSAERFYYNKYNNKNDERKIRNSLVNGLHIYIGDNDLHPYMCIPNLNITNLEPICKIWILHQALHRNGIDFNHLESFFNHPSNNIEDWLQNDKYASCYNEDIKESIRDKKELFLKIKASKKSSLLDCICSSLHVSMSVSLV